ncbi:MAG: bifunctional diaminohydroxyphosphoribosylaminopyrimidine deaminase/5-amino-6-(5-phosphoribosylamino)uracil reductase RibD [Planctomycetota bacterium]|nr:MAG: bifunctional diaminohydroxyphosphoribosylaminopyrimidine deaminase/5-amino-6-(5-phosphoribosylamino)uracil reductase RibD [Planctomycetota bacterium]
MRRALDLAARGDYRTRPNPKVGAVVARGDKVLAEGHHAVSGGPHAEAAALDALPPGAARGATLYVTLEPCGPFAGKRTPPCVERVLASELARVVVAQTDPHPEVGGRSLERLRAAGLRVDVGLLEDAARRLNGPYRKWIKVRRPYVTAKWAMSLDGRIATAEGDSQWISCGASRRAVHRLRGEVDAVLVGVGTALADDPLLTRRGVEGGTPLRVVLDSRARLPLDSRLVRTAREVPLLVATGSEADPERSAALRVAGAEVLSCGAGPRPDPLALLDVLAARDLRHALLEGGGEVAAAFLEADAIDRVLCFVGPRLIGGDGAPGPLRGRGFPRLDDAPRLRHLEARPSGDDVLLEGHLHVY